MSAPRDGRMREEILHDSAATLRQVAEVLTDLGEGGGAVAEARVLHAVHEVGHSPAKLTELIRTLLRAYAQLLTLAETLAKKRDVVEGLARGHMEPSGRAADGRTPTDVGSTLGYVVTVLDALEERIHELIDAFHVPVLGFTAGGAEPVAARGAATWPAASEGASALAAGAGAEPPPSAGSDGSAAQASRPAGPRAGVLDSSGYSG